MPARTAPHFRRRNSAIPRGAAAIEFAFIFPLFFLIFYATVSYSMMLLVQMGLNNAAADGTRATIQLVSPLANNQTTFNAAATQEVVRAVQTSLNWLSKDQVAAIVSTIDVRSAPAGRVTVQLQWKDYSNKPLIPSLMLPIVGQVPALPKNITGTATMLR